MKPRILIAGCVQQNPEVLRAHLQTLKWQTGDFEVTYAFVNDNVEKESSLILREQADILFPADPKPVEAKYAVGSKTHEWSVPTFYWLAQQKQKLIDLARKERYDAIWIVDSDLLCSPDTLSSLWSARKDVVSAVFWTRWQPEAPPLPQVWMAHPYELQGRGIEAHEFLGSLAARSLVRVAGLGACTLIRAGVFDKVAYWPLVEGLPTHSMWQGEDRHFCVRAERNRVELWADAWPDVWHCYRPEDREKIDNQMAWLENGCNPHCQPWSMSVGDLVSFSVEPLEVQAIAGHAEFIRGRIGAIRMLPQIEKELLSMRAGDERLIRLRFPLWYKLENFRGREKLIRLRLLHVKPNGPHPTLDDTPVAGISESFMAA